MPEQDRQMHSYVKRNIEARSCNRCGSVKAISITYSECVSVALVMRHAKRMCCIIFLSVASMALTKYRVIRKSLRDFRTRLRNNQDRHGRKEHIKR